MANPRLSAHRQIGFAGSNKPELEKAIKLVEKKSKSGKSNERAILDDPSLQIFEWVETHKYFKLAPMCEAVGYNAANFLKASKHKSKIPQKYIEPIINILKEYGYAN